MTASEIWQNIVNDLETIGQGQYGFYLQGDRMKNNSTPKEERAKMEKLKFGDKQSINLRDRAEEENLIKELLPKVKCPLCGAKANAAWSIDIKEGYIGWNFDCKPECHNSVEWCQEHCWDDMDGCFTNLKGKYEESRY